MKKLFAVLALCMCSTVAMAAPPVDGPPGQINRTKNTTINNTTNNTTNQGGTSVAGAVAGASNSNQITNSATGGTGGSAVGIGMGGSGGSVRDSGNSSNLNLNSNVANGGAGGQGGQGGAGGNATGGTSSASAGSSSSSSANNSGNNQSTTFEADKRSRVEIQTTGQAPDVISNATAPCRVALGASAGWLGGALGFSGSVLDEGCDAREDSRLLFNMGEKAASISRLCAKPEMAAALGEVKCPKPKQEEPTPPVGG